MCFDSGEYVTETLLCRNNSFLQPYTQNLINSNTGNVGRPVVTLGDAHGYMGRLREEFEQQTSKLKGDHQGSSVDLPILTQIDEF